LTKVLVDVSVVEAAVALIEELGTQDAPASPLCGYPKSVRDNLQETLNQTPPEAPTTYSVDYHGGRLVLYRGDEKLISVTDACDLSNAIKIIESFLQRSDI